MPALQIGSVVFPLAPGAIPCSYEDVAAYRRRSNGTMEVEDRGVGRARVWTPESLPLARTDADTLEAALLAAGTVEASGDEVGSPNQTVYVRGVSRSDRSRGGGSGTYDRCTLVAELVGVDG